MTDLTRRRAMAIAGATGMAVVAGCSSSGEEDDSGTGDDEGDDQENGDPNGDDGTGDDGNGDESNPVSGTVLGDVFIENVNDTEHSVDVLVEFGDEIEHWSSHDLEAGGDGATLDRDWTTDPGEFRVTVRLDDDEFTQVTPERWNDPACLNLLALVTRDGEVTLLSDTNGGPCGSGDSDFDD
ncbi:hypothetical protein OB905_13385 [Halobacteria archaeon AArc-dxtr1]|nr:hypothetical protein [Halobacteria archaeon AArc-dxtr1]